MSAPDIRGIPPQSVPAPTGPGYYWLRMASARWVCDFDRINGKLGDGRCYYNWEFPNFDVVLVDIDERGHADVFGDECGYELNTATRKLVQVIEKLYQPT